MAGRKVMDSLANTILTYEHFIDKENTSRFVNKTSEDESQLIQDQKNVNTEKKTKYDMNNFNQFLRHKGEVRKAHLIPAPELDKIIANYMISTRKEGKEYEPGSLTSKFNSISRYLKDHNYGKCIKTDIEFEHSRRVLESKRKELKAIGKGNLARKAEKIEGEDITTLKNQGLLGTDSPKALLNSVWMLFTQQFGLRSVAPQVQMMWGDVELKTDSVGNEYLEYTERTTKTRSGKTRDSRSFAPKAFANAESDQCPVKLYKEYRSHRPVSCLAEDTRMFLQALPTDRIKDEVWYSKVPLGKNSLGKMVQSMFAEAGISGRHTNHSMRRTMITSALEKGVHETKIMQISGHKNVQSLNEYRTISVPQQREISNILSNSLEPSETVTSVTSQTTASVSQTSASAPQTSASAGDNFDDFGISDAELMGALFSPLMKCPTVQKPTHVFQPSGCTFNGPVYVRF